MSFAQGTPSVNTLINSSNTLVIGNTSTGTALTVQQLGAGNVFSTSNASGTVGLFVSPTSNVGVGTTSPAAALDVSGGTIIGSAGNTNWRIQPQYVGSSPFPSQVRITNAWDAVAGTGQANYAGVGINLNSYQGGSQLEFYTSSTNNAVPTQRMVIGSAGTVGIGLASPPSQLTVALAANAEKMSVAAWSNKYFSVGLNPTTTSNCVSLGFDDTGSGGWMYSLAPNVAWRGMNYGAASHSFYFGGVGSTAGVVFDSSGRVGIGVVSPSYPLDVNGSARIQGDCFVSASNTMTLYANTFTFRIADTASGTVGTPKVIINSNGPNSGSPQTLVMGVDGATFVQTAYLDTQKGGVSATTPLAFRMNGTEYMRINSSGNVGIGTTYPDYWAYGTTTQTAQNFGVVVDGSFVGWGIDTASKVLSTNYTVKNTSGNYVRVACITMVASSNTSGSESADMAFLTKPSTASTGVQTRMTITSAGNVGIGTASPGSPLEVVSSAVNAEAIPLYLRNNATQTLYNVQSVSMIFGPSASSGAGTGGQAKITGGLADAGGGGYLAFSTYLSSSGYAERMRILSTGNVGIGTTNPGPMLDIWATGTSFQNNGSLRFYRSDVGTFWKFSGPDTGNTLYLQNAGGVGVSISNGSTSWVAASDSRLKNIIEPISNALSKVELLNPIMYSWKSDETNEPHPGLIAQDVLKVQPEAVSSDKDGMYGVRYTELIPLAFAAIKELSALVQTQQTTISSLEQSLVTATANFSSLEQRLAALESRA